MTTESMRSRLLRHRWSMRALLFLGSLLFIELLLQLACLVSPTLSHALSPWRAAMIADDRLGVRGDPAYPGHDTRGFRNPQVPETTEIVAIGDSQTYGTSVRPDEPWPRELERMSGRTVYNLSFAGWDPVRYRIALAEALALKPKLVIVGVYPGNDLYGAFRSCYVSNLAPDLKDPVDAEQIEQLERTAPLENEMAELTEKMVGYHVSAGWRDTGRLLSEWVKLVALCRAIRLQYVVWQDSRWDVQKQLAAAAPKDLSIFDTPHARTIFTTQYRTQGMDLDDARIAAGLRATERVLADMDRQCREANCRLLVVLIPVKEFVFAPLVDDPKRFVGLEKLCRLQHSAIDQLSDFLQQAGIEVVDATPILESSVTRDKENPYLPNIDGHPSPAGHRALAQELAKHALVAP